MADVALVVCFEDARRERFVVVRHRERAWELPGGTVEPDESPLEAAVREFREEVGHVLEEPRAVTTIDRGDRTDHVVTGHLGPATVHGSETDDEKVLEHALVGSLDDVPELSYPDDPYDAISTALGRPLRP